MADISQLEAYLDTRGFLDYLLRRRRAHCGDPAAAPGTCGPARPPGRRGRAGRGRSCRRCYRAAADAGFRPEYLGKIPSPALVHFALRRRAAGVMVTGSHIPFERNGIKYNTPSGKF